MREATAPVMSGLAPRRRWTSVPAMTLGELIMAWLAVEARPARAAATSPTALGNSRG
jgi:hypothetical protein